MRGFLRWFFITVSCATVLTGRAQDQPRLVTRYGPDEGFTSAMVFDILRDTKGFMWFGTTGGLYRFDGHSFQVFKPVANDTLSLSDVFVRHLFQDSKGFLWVGTQNGGLCRFDPQKQIFQRFHDPKDSLKATNQINGIAEDKSGNIWVASDRSLFRYKAGAGWKRFRFPVAQLPAKHRNKTFGIYVSRDGTVWLGYSRRTFARFDPSTLQFKHYDFNSVPFVGSGLVRFIREDGDGILWMSAIDGGIIRFDPRQETSVFIPPPQDQVIMSLQLLGANLVTAGSNGIMIMNKSDFSFRKPFDNPIYGIEEAASTIVFKESDDAIWLGSTGTGVMRIQLVSSLHIEPTKFNSPLDNVVKSGSLHVYGYPGKGLMLRESGSLADFRKSEQLYPSAINFRLRDVLRDKRGNIWLAAGDLLGIENKAKNRSQLNHIKSTYTERIENIAEDSDGRIWVGGDGWQQYNPTTGFSKGFRKASGNQVEAIKATSAGIWIATADGGVGLFNPQTETTVDHIFSPSDTSSISNSYASQLHIDRSGDLWVGTLSGLDRYNPLTKNFTRFRIPSPESAVYRLDEDLKGNLLVQTKDGIYQFEVPTSGKSATIKKLQSPIKLSHGKGFLHYPWFTWQQGDYLAECHLDSITPPPVPPRVAITKFSLDPNNKNPLSPEEARLNPAYRERIELDYDQNLFNIEFTALDFADPGENQYAYRLKGFDEAWSNSGTRHQVTYTNLDHGAYVFEVSGANAYGVWSTEPARLEIVIHPPVWKTVWAYAAYVAGTVLLLLLARRNTINRERLKAQVAIEKAEKDALKDLDKLKTKFFSNITHEFRTPLTLIQGPATELFDKVKDPESRQLLRMISSNSNRLLKLINQMLDLARLDAGEMKAALKDTNLSDFFTARISQFTSLAASRGINFTWKLSDDLPSAMVDDEKLEAITINLISNALKFTPEVGRVTVSVQWLNGALQLDVEDTGRGIPADKLNRIYDRFYQVEPNDSSHSEGTGIGLALVKQYTEIMHGRVQVESAPGVGTRFTVTIPAATGTAPNSLVPPEQLYVTEENQSAESDLPLLLLVDDSEEIRTFIKVCLGKHFRYEEARHGREGLEMAIEHLPDLIISDLMMPEMDGLELCTRLRKDKRTDHIPFVMLTAKAAEGDKLGGLQTGAVEYLVKPFNKAELLVKVQNLIALRTKLQAHIRTSILAQATQVQAESAEEQFVLKARRFVEEHIKDENLSVETLAREMNLSREQCYRKLTAITGMSPSAFIRKIKLQRANQLLASKWGTVSQVAYESGFENLSHFSKAFKEEFGKLPSEV